MSNNRGNFHLHRFTTSENIAISYRGWLLFTLTLYKHDTVTITNGFNNSSLLCLVGMRSFVCTLLAYFLLTSFYSNSVIYHRCKNFTDVLRAGLFSRRLCSGVSIPHEPLSHVPSSSSTLIFAGLSHLCKAIYKKCRCYGVTELWVVCMG